jgi:transcriptional regulator with XRE-family HTH domain
VGVNDGPTPMVHRRRLRTELVNAREHAGLTQEQVAEAMDWSPSKVARIEGGEVRISTNDLKALLPLYHINDTAHTGRLIALARAAKQNSWWNVYKDILPKQFGDFIDYEAAASVVSSFQSLVVPGLLQTRDYARIVLQQHNSIPAPDPPDKLTKLVEVRMKRQELLDRTSPPKLELVLDEAVIHRVIGDSELMRRQVHYLIEAAARSPVTLQILPFAAGVWPGMDRSFSILEFTDRPDDRIVYLESTKGGVNRQDISEDSLFYRHAFDRLREMAFDSVESIAYLRKVADELAGVV